MSHAPSGKDDTNWGGLLDGVTDYVWGTRNKERPGLLLPRVLWMPWVAPLGGAQLMAALV